MSEIKWCIFLIIAAEFFSLSASVKANAQTEQAEQRDLVNIRLRGLRGIKTLRVETGTPEEDNELAPKIIKEQISQRISRAGFAITTDEQMSLPWILGIVQMMESGGKIPYVISLIVFDLVRTNSTVSQPELVRVWQKDMLGVTSDASFDSALKTGINALLDKFLAEHAEANSSTVADTLAVSSKYLLLPSEMDKYLNDAAEIGRISEQTGAPVKLAFTKSGIQTSWFKSAKMSTEELQKLLHRLKTNWTVTDTSH